MSFIRVGDQIINTNYVVAIETWPDGAVVATMASAEADSVALIGAAAAALRERLAGPAPVYPTPARRPRDDRWTSPTPCERI